MQSTPTLLQERITKQFSEEYGATGQSVTVIGNGLPQPAWNYSAIGTIPSTWTPGEPRTITLPAGTVITVNADGTATAVLPQ